jgi:hypothetical protein
MSRYQITNNSKAPRGVYSAAGRLVFIQPGQTRTMDIANIDPVRRNPFLEAVCVDELPDVPADLAAAVKRHPLDHDGDGKKGGSTSPVTEIKALRAAYTEKMGKRPFSGWDADELLRRMGDA